MIRNSTTSYGWISIAFHWLSAVTVFGLFGLGVWMVELSYYNPWYKEGPNLHRAIGVLLLLGTLARLVWRMMQPRPRPLKSHQRWETALAHLTHALLYLLLLLVMGAGYLISTADGRAIWVFDLFSVPALWSGVAGQAEWAGIVHRWGAYLLITLAVLHGAAALKHQLFDKDHTLRRMLKPQSGETR